MILGNSHRQELITPVPLVEHVVGVFSELLHVRSNQHLPQFDEIAVFLVVNFDDSPRVGSTSDVGLAGGKGEEGVGSDNGEGDFGLWVGWWGVG